ncbi:MAG TPA: penicillin acylase family protein [Segetibacter sp.]
MRIVAFLISLTITTALVVALNMQLPIGNTKTPKLGSFLSPQHGFWQNAESDSLRLNKDLKFAALKGNVDVYYDDRLVPHIYADDETDAYFVQGYIHAKFRLWQMEFQTHAASGRLSEIMGATSGGTDFVAVDKFFRRLGMGYAAENSLKELEANPVTKTAADAYTNGINAYIKSLKPNQYPFEYKLLAYKPEPWTNLKTALFLKYMSYDLAGAEWDFEMTNAKNVFSAEDFERIYPSIQDSLEPIIPRNTAFADPALKVVAPATADSLYYKMKDSLQQVFLKPDEGNGSNNWAVAGAKTRSGKPILCNDPHLGLNLPALWFEMQITTPSFSSYGATFPGAPSVIIGFNDSCAWGFTNAMRDVRDYYEIPFEDTTMKRYRQGETLLNSTFRKEVIKVKGQPDIIQNIAMTVYGPVMYDRHYPNKLKDGKSYAVRWKAHDASNELLTFNKLNHAKNFNDFEDAISTYKTPGQNMLFASRSGDIAIKQQGEFPAKWRRQGDFVMPGDSSYMWQGMIAGNENPSQYNPVRGFVSSANQLPVDENYPYYLGGSYPPYRGFIINRRLALMNNITPQDMQQLQTDNYNVFAEMARPVLLKYIDDTELNSDEITYLNKVKTWNLRNDVGEAGATVFKHWWDSLEVCIWQDEFLQTKFPLKWPDESTLLEGLLKDTAYKFADDIRTQAVETIADMVQRSFTLAYRDVKKLDASNNLAWGKYKNTGVRHLLKIPALSRLSLPVGGGEHVINATKQNHGASWRMIVSLTDTIEAYGVYPGGQSGNPGSKYYDTFIDTWAAGKYYTLNFLTRDQAKRSDKIKWSMTFTKG